MTTNYILLVVTGLFSVFSVIDMVRGTGRVKPLWMIGVILVFILVVVATAMGLTYDQLLAIIEGR